ncbi:MAG: chromosomal replication initiator protein DnaA [Solirubrobacteraceae bacterium]
MPAGPDHAAWGEITAALRSAVDERTYGLWLAPLDCEAITGDILHLTGPPEVATWASDRLGRVIQSCAAVVLGPHVTVEISTASGAKHSRRAASSVAARDLAPNSCPPDDALHPKYTFEQFVIGTHNRLAHAAALHVAELPAQAYNPLFIYGPPGLGKTHLLHSVGNHVRAYGGGLEVRYSTVEAFTAEFVSALGSKTTASFKQRFRGVDVLLLDDVQFLQRKARTEEEFFHTFNALYEAGSQIVLTSDRLPGDLGELEDRLRERFASGLICDIGRPDFATRLAVLRKRAAHDHLLLDDEALQVVAAAGANNIRALEGALIRVVAYASLTSRPLTAELAEEVVSRLSLRAKAAAPPTVSHIQEATCKLFSITREELLSRSRDPRLIWPRHLAMYLSRELTNDSLPVIGKQFGGRDHTTVLNAHRRASEQMKSDTGAYAQVEQLTSAINRIA